VGHDRIEQSVSTGTAVCYVVTAFATRSTWATSGLQGNRINSSQPRR
jgi:hypothetical protein